MGGPLACPDVNEVALPYLSCTPPRLEGRSAQANCVPAASRDCMVAESVYPVPRWLREYLVDVVLLLVGQGVHGLEGVQILRELAAMTATTKIRYETAPTMMARTGDTAKVS